MVKDDLITKVAITGNTKLTLKSMEMILKIPKYKILYLFGISEDSMSSKVNSVKMEQFCSENGIILNKTEDWSQLYDFCLSNGITKIITLGDSRIIPKNIVQKFDVIGNHGAALPDVQGGASLVWGRMLNSGNWGISIMKIAERVDSGDILKVKRFSYDNISEEQFVTTADDLTIAALREVLHGDYTATENKRWKVRASKHVDSYDGVGILKYCLENNIPVYMPTRTPVDGKLSRDWPSEFIKVFKIANNFPYPKWSE